MRWKGLAIGSAGMLAILAWAGIGRASDAVLLGGNVSTQAAALAVAAGPHGGGGHGGGGFHGGGGHGGGYHGGGWGGGHAWGGGHGGGFYHGASAYRGYGGWHGGYGGWHGYGRYGGWNGYGRYGYGHGYYRPYGYGYGRYWGGYYRPYWRGYGYWGGYYRPYWRGYGWGGYWWGPSAWDWVSFGLNVASPWLYGYPSVDTYPSAGYLYTVPEYPAYLSGVIVGSTTTVTPDPALQSVDPPAGDLAPAPQPVQPAQPAQPGETYPYDGGPANPVPMPPRSGDQPSTSPPSKDLAPVKYVYRAFGEDTTGTSLAGLRAVPVDTTLVRKTGR